MKRVFAAGKNPKIFNGVVQFIPINMMDVFIFLKKSTKIFFHDKSMFCVVFRFYSWMVFTQNKAISILIYLATAFPSWMSFSSQSRSRIAGDSSATCFPKWDRIRFIPSDSSFSCAFFCFWTHFISKGSAPYRAKFFKDLIWPMSEFRSAIFTDRENRIFAFHGGNFSI